MCLGLFCVGVQVRVLGSGVWVGLVVLESSDVSCRSAGKPALNQNRAHVAHVSMGEIPRQKREGERVGQ